VTGTFGFVAASKVMERLARDAIPSSNEVRGQVFPEHALWIRPCTLASAIHGYGRFWKDLSTHFIAAW